MCYQMAEHINTLQKLDKLIEETEEERTTEGVYWIDAIINEVNTNIDVLDVATRGFLEKLSMKQRLLFQTG
jgi:hypothetical protein